MSSDRSECYGGDSALQCLASLATRLPDTHNHRIRINFKLRRKLKMFDSVDLFRLDPTSLSQNYRCNPVSSDANGWLHKSSAR